MSSATARFALPLLHPGQAQKEHFHNEALTLADALIQPCAEAIGINTPPAAPVAGQCWIVGESPTGEWSGAARAMALWTASGWRFIAPREGMGVWIASDAVSARFSAGTWRNGRLSATRLEIDGEQVVGPREPSIEDPDGGAVVDVEGRVAIDAILGVLRNHGLIDPP